MLSGKYWITLQNMFSVILSVQIESLLIKLFGRASNRCSPPSLALSASYDPLWWFFHLSSFSSSNRPSCSGPSFANRAALNRFLAWAKIWETSWNLRFELYFEDSYLILTSLDSQSGCRSKAINIDAISWNKKVFFLSFHIVRFSWKASSISLQKRAQIFFLISQNKNYPPIII